MLSDLIPDSIKNFPNKFPLTVHPKGDELSRQSASTLFIAPYLSEKIKLSREWQSLRYQIYLSFNPKENFQVQVAESNLQSPIGRLPFVLNSKGDPSILKEMDNQLSFNQNSSLNDLSLIYLVDQKLGLALDYFIVTDGFETILKNNWFKDQPFPLNQALPNQYQNDTLERIRERMSNLNSEDILTDAALILTELNSALTSDYFSNSSIPNELDVTLFSIAFLTEKLFASDHALAKLFNRFEKISQLKSKIYSQYKN